MIAALFGPMRSAITTKKRTHLTLPKSYISFSHMGTFSTLLCSLKNSQVKGRRVHSPKPPKFPPSKRVLFYLPMDLSGSRIPFPPARRHALNAQFSSPHKSRLAPDAVSSVPTTRTLPSNQLSNILPPANNPNCSLKPRACLFLPPFYGFAPPK